MKTWTKTKTQGLLKHQSGSYYGRYRVGGKDKWVPLETSVLEIAKHKFDEEKQAIALAAKKGWEPEAGAIQVQVAVERFKTGLEHRLSLKPSTRQFYLWSVKAILTSWPELPAMDVRHVTEIQCQQWAKTFSDEYSATYYNNAVLVLNAIFEAAIKAGVIYRNPAQKLEMRRKTQKALTLPTKENFFKIVTFVKNGAHRTAKASAELIEFLAYTGCRISEAQRVTWGDCDFARETILIKGDANTATKNWKVRTVPMIAAAKNLLEKMKLDRGQVSDEKCILLVGDARGSLEKAVKNFGIPSISHHDLRHLFATSCIEAGVDVPSVSRWLGHSDGGALAMRVYGHLRDEHSKAAAAKVTF